MRVFVTVKTYPVLSGRYIETACSAGIDEQGRWVRLYPIPFRLLDRQNQYRKYQWIEVSAERNRQDMRPESHLVTDVDAIRLCETIGPENQWAARRELVLAGRPPVYDELAEIVRLAHNNEISLAIFKPAEIIDFRSEDAEPWPEARIQRANKHVQAAGVVQFRPAPCSGIHFCGANSKEVFLRIQGCLRKQQHPYD